MATTEYVARYAKHEAATYNAALTRLETQALMTGNAMELVASGTLSSDTNEINMSLGSISWAWLTLRAMIVMKSVGFTKHLTLRCTPGPATTATGNQLYFNISTGLYVYEGLLPDNAATVDAINPTMIEMTIWPHGQGINALTDSYRLDSAGPMLTHTTGGTVYITGQTPTALLLAPDDSILPVGVFGVGSTYRLEGVRR